MVMLTMCKTYQLGGRIPCSPTRYPSLKHLLYGRVWMTFVLLLFHSLNSDYCSTYNPLNKSAVYTTPAGIGALNKTLNFTQYRVGVVHCPLGLTPKTKYTYCKKGDSTLAAGDGDCIGESRHYSGTCHFMYRWNTFYLWRTCQHQRQM